jgi:hypothetical protein
MNKYSQSGPRLKKFPKIFSTIAATGRHLVFGNKIRLKSVFEIRMEIEDERQCKKACSYETA